MPVMNEYKAGASEPDPITKPTKDRIKNLFIFGELNDGARFGAFRARDLWDITPLHTAWGKCLEYVLVEILCAEGMRVGEPPQILDTGHLVFSNRSRLGQDHLRWITHRVTPQLEG